MKSFLCLAFSLLLSIAGSTQLGAWSPIPTSSIPSYVLTQVAQQTPALANEAIITAYSQVVAGVIYKIVYANGSTVTVTCGLPAAKKSDPTCIAGVPMTTIATATAPTSVSTSTTPTNATTSTTVPTATTNFTTTSSTASSTTTIPNGVTTETSTTTTIATSTEATTSTSTFYPCIYMCVQPHCDNGQCVKLIPRTPGVQQCCQKYTCER